MIAAIVPAAGFSTRMGRQNKLLLPYGASTILGTVLHNLQQSQAGELVLVTGKAPGLPGTLVNSERLQVLVNPRAEAGLTGSIQLGIRHASPQAEAYLICLADMPLLQAEDYNLLINNYLSIKNKSILIPVREGMRGNPVLFSRHFKEELLAAPAGDGCKPVVKANSGAVVQVPVASKHFFVDIDTPDDYRQYRGK